MADSPNEALVRKFFDKLNAEDLEGLRTILHPQATWKPMSNSDIPGAGVHTGHKGIIDEFLKPVRGLFEGKDPQNSIQTLFGKGNQVVAETHGTGRFRNGKTYDNRYCWVVDVRVDDLLVRRCHGRVRAKILDPRRGARGVELGARNRDVGAQHPCRQGELVEGPSAIRDREPVPRQRILNGRARQRAAGDTLAVGARINRGRRNVLTRGCDEHGAASGTDTQGRSRRGAHCNWRLWM